MGNFFTSDWHLGDPRMEILSRPFEDENEMAQAIARAYDAKITDEDTVYIVGDVVAQTSWDWRSFLKARPGRKILLRGNYDRHLSDEDLAPYFDQIVAEDDGLEVEIEHAGQNLRVWVTHYPSLSRPDLFNLVGHIHNSWRVQKNMMNVGVDANHFQPLDEKTILFIYTGICKFYDQDVWVADHPANEPHEKRGKEGTYLEAHKSQN